MPISNHLMLLLKVTELTLFALNLSELTGKIVFGKQYQVSQSASS